MLELGADIEFIQKVTGLSLETIEGLKDWSFEWAYKDKLNATW